MAKITAIEIQKKNPNRVSIYLDGEYAFGLSRIVAAWLKVGQDLIEEKIAELQSLDAREVAMQKALNFLGYRARSMREVRENLLKHEIPEPVVETTIQRLQESGLLNDQDFAKAWVENRNTFRPRARRALAMELRQKGLAEDVIRETLDQGSDDESLALEAARKYQRKVQALDWLEFRKKLSGFLGRRGFSYAVIMPVVKKLWDEIHPGSENEIFNDEDLN